ncbi:MAG: hypothetical protein ACLFRY_02795 [Spirochaetia bacterium]
MKNNDSRSRARTRWSLLVPVILAAVTLAGCEAFFTFNVFSGLQRDPASLPPEQQVRYAEEALAGGDTAAMQAAYPLIAAQADANPDDPELQFLAADLAIGASGVNDLIADFDPDTATADDLNEALSSVDTGTLGEVAGYIQAAEDAGGTPTEAQYANAAASIVVQEADEAGGFENIDWDPGTNPDIQDALTYADNAGIDIQGMFEY